MSKKFSIFLLIGFIVCTIFAVSSYRAEQPGARLFGKYFSAVPVEGYSVQRSLSVGVNDEDASIIRQAYTYHKATDYDLALVSFRAYLESNPVPTDDEVLLLAATSAVATGNYSEGTAYLNQIEEGGNWATEARWHMALIDLQQGNFAAARSELKKIAKSEAVRSPAALEILEKIPTP